MIFPNTNSQYALNVNVVLSKEEDLVYMLDFDNGQFYALDQMAGLMLSLVLEKGYQSAIVNISADYEVSQEQIKKDLDELIVQLHAKNLIHSTDQSHTQDNNIIIRFINNILKKKLLIITELCRKTINPQADINHTSVNLLLTLSWLSFRILGWNKTLSLWRQWHGQTLAIMPENLQEILQNIDKTIRTSAASKLLLPIVCKERALVGYQVLHTFYQLPAELVLGIQKYPLHIHAWVECQGMIVTDEPAHCQTYTPIWRND